VVTTPGAASLRRRGLRRGRREERRENLLGKGEGAVRRAVEQRVGDGLLLACRVAMACSTAPSATRRKTRTLRVLTDPVARSIAWRSTAGREPVGPAALEAGADLHGALVQAAGPARVDLDAPALGAQPHHGLGNEGERFAPVVGVFEIRRRGPAGEGAVAGTRVSSWTSDRTRPCRS
jgi:hypothetical protein